MGFSIALWMEKNGWVVLELGGREAKNYPSAIRGIVYMPRVRAEKNRIWCPALAQS